MAKRVTATCRGMLTSSCSQTAMSASKYGALSSPAGPPNLSNAALKSVSSLMGLQLFSRLISFALNQALVRLATPDVYGTVSIQLELLLNTILFLSREGFRNALLRADVTISQVDASLLVSNIALLPVYLGSPFLSSPLSPISVLRRWRPNHKPCFMRR